MVAQLCVLYLAEMVAQQVFEWNAYTWKSLISCVCEKKSGFDESWI
jgi:hypothetical protein